MLYISLQYRYKNIRDLDIFVYVSLRSCDKPLRNIDYLTVDVPFSRTETLKNSFFTRVCRAWKKTTSQHQGIQHLTSLSQEIV